ncbi:NPCBM/NEW2 domain-containing protein [Nonomuraea rubra]
MIKDLVPIEQDIWDTPWEIVEAQIDGEVYPDTLWATNCSIIQTGRQVYVIGKDYTRFKSIAGVGDFSKRASPVYFSIIGDGETIYKRKVRPGTPASINIPVSGVIQLTLKIEIDDYNSDCDKTLALWAKARLER